MRRSAAVILSVLAMAVALPTQASPSAAAKTLKCTKETLEGKNFRRCRGLVKAKDGTVMLDTDVTLPAKGDGPFPLVVLLHGLGGSKESYAVSFEGDEDFDPETDSIEGTGGRYRYNNAWFASRGYAVLNYTARGFHDDECLEQETQAADSDPVLYPNSPACGVQLASMDHEIKDTQYLIGRLVDGSLLGVDAAINFKKIGVTGVSYGGGQTWMLTRDSVWRSPKGTKVKVAVAAPIIGWTDILDALAPNGVVHEGLMPPLDVDARKAEPPGVVKKSYIDRFIVGMRLTANLQNDLPDYLEGWYEAAVGGEPYGGDVWTHGVDSLLTNRSAYYVPQDRQVPIIAAQGWTDHIFPAVQAVQMAHRLASEGYGAPLRVLLSDFGHPIAQNPADVIAYQAYALNYWFDHYLRNKGAAPTSGFESFETVCSEMGEQAVSNFVADSFEGLTAGTSTFELSMDGNLDTSASDPHRGLLDPFPLGAVTGCRDTDTLVAEGNLAESVLLPEGFRMLGMPAVTLQADPSADGMYVAFHLWDVSPDGETQALVDRGVFRLGAAGPQQVVVRLQGNNYDFGAGHSLKLELTANDSPSFLATNAEGTVMIGNVVLEMPAANPDAEAQG